MSTVLAVDPGNEESAYTVFGNGRPFLFAKIKNELLLEILALGSVTYEHLVIEGIASYGMPVGREVFDTCEWIGRFVQHWGGPYTKLYRRDIKLHLCGSARAKDANVRQALIDRYGGKAAAIGTKMAPGPLYGVKADIWSALAVAVTYCDLNQQLAKDL